MGQESTATSAQQARAGSRWDTVPPGRRLLAVAHNVTAATRLLDLLRVVGGDRRVATSFTSPGSSAFPDGLTEFFDARGIVHLPWADAVAQRFDAAISTSRGGELHALQAALIYTPHGAGFNKTLPSESAHRIPGPGAFGLTRDWLVHDGAVVPSVLLVSHHEQIDRLRLDCPEAVPRAVVAGDPCADQLAAARPFRAAYRAALGVPDGVALVVVSSTWGPASLLGAAPQVVERAVAELPVDEYRVLLAVHPNVWHRHSPWQVRSWLAPLLDAGLLLPEPSTEDWKCALIAADCLLGDHGSLTAYGSWMRLPTLLGAFDKASVAPGSPMETLGRVLPRFAADLPLAGQLRRAAADVLRLAEAAEASCVTSEPGGAAAVLRQVVYRTLGLDEPAGSATVPVPALPSSHNAAAPAPRPYHAAQLVHAVRETGNRIRVRRYAHPARGPHIPADAVLVADASEPNPSVANNAEILIASPPAGHSTAPPQTAWALDLLTRHPGCRAAAAPGRPGAWCVWARTGRNHVRELHATTDPDGSTPALPSMIAAAALLAWLDAVDTSEHPQIEVSAGPALTARLTIDVTSTSFDLPPH
ncbi:hypothetical protein ACPA54_34935 [Uniformispora flossi]|uniref:hypothetical protein n=1 Tax=Uniformispora flossi TaxID=3390723 RepID=UPI003C2B7C41